MNYQTIKKQLESYKLLEQQNRSTLLLVLIANVEGKTSEFDDYPNTSVLSEYYTLDEYELISTTYKKMGYELLNYFTEREFMSAIINHEIHTLHKKMFIINSAQTGIYVGRKSLIPAFCDHFKIMYTGSNPYVVSLCRDKFRSNAILRQYLPNQMDTYLYSADNGWLEKTCPQVGQKVIAKLNEESASIGLNQDNVLIYSSECDHIFKALSQKYMQSIIVQPFISGYEVELPIIVGESVFPLFPIGIQMGENKLLGNKFLDYNTRFYHTYDFYNFDSFDHSLSERLRTNAMKVAELLGIRGLGRVDFRITPDGDYYAFDIATNPHITMDSSCVFAFQELDYSYSDMLSIFLGVSLSKYIKL